MRTRDDEFFRVARASHPTSSGPVELPILYYDVSTLTAFFTVERQLAAALLAGAGLAPVLLAGDRAVAGLGCYEYRDTTVGPYHEVGLGLPVVPLRGAPPRIPLVDLLRRPRHRRAGFYVLDLPVSTAIACAAGRELWGFPKFVTDIPFELGDGAFRCEVADPAGGPPLVALAGRLGPGVPAPAMSMVTYSHLGARDLRTEVDVRGRNRLHSGRGLALTVSDADHPMARHARALGLDGARPLLVLETARFQSRLNAGSDYPLRTSAERAAARQPAGSAT
jgi:hypothetical protein